VTLLLLRDMTDLLQSPDMTAALTDEPPAPAESEDSAPPRILVAEDSLVNQRIILRFLEHLGYSADVAVNGYDVLRLMHEQLYDIILMDVQMPELDGIEATRRIRAEYPAHQQPRIIALTAYTQQHELEQCIEAGMNGHMSKSLRLNELAAVLAQYRPQAAAPPSDRTPLPAPEEVIDERVLHQLISQLGSNGPARFDELITIFLEHTTGFFSEIERALEENNGQHLRYIAHTLKSSSASLGATRLTARCRDVIDACAANDQARARASARQIITELHAAQAALTQIQADTNVRLNDEASS
jgi:CheY-like chemotaxis protein/HPt (histidine-containing phosphotransfer) domain-containing protein